MLVLTRKPGETVATGQDIKVTVLSDRNGQVRLGILAPRDMPIVREEIADRDRKNRPAMVDALDYVYG